MNNHTNLHLLEIYWFTDFSTTINYLYCNDLLTEKEKSAQNFLSRLLTEMCIYFHMHFLIIFFVAE